MRFTGQKLLLVIFRLARSEDRLLKQVRSAAALQDGSRGGPLPESTKTREDSGLHRRHTEGAYYIAVRLDLDDMVAWIS
jgi:hypothetical protein